MREFALSLEECEGVGGHCFTRTNIVLTSNPPQYPEVCKHCGATRTGRQQAPMSYTDIEPRSDS